MADEISDTALLKEREKTAGLKVPMPPVETYQSGGSW
jgi:hypothetical protein